MTFTTLYKANRPPDAPEDLRPQFPLTREATKGLQHRLQGRWKGLRPMTSLQPWLHQARDAGGRVTIISSDKDLMQLVGGGVEMLDAMKNKRIDRDGVVEKVRCRPRAGGRCAGAGRAIASTTCRARRGSGSRPPPC